MSELPTTEPQHGRTATIAIREHGFTTRKPARLARLVSNIDAMGLLCQQRAAVSKRVGDQLAVFFPLATAGYQLSQAHASTIDQLVLKRAEVAATAWSFSRTTTHTPDEVDVYVQTELGIPADMLAMMPQVNLTDLWRPTVVEQGGAAALTVADVAALTATALLFVLLGKDLPLRGTTTRLPAAALVDKVAAASYAVGATFGVPHARFEPVVDATAVGELEALYTHAAYDVQPKERHAPSYEPAKQRANHITGMVRLGFNDTVEFRIERLLVALLRWRHRYEDPATPADLTEYDELRHALPRMARLPTAWEHTPQHAHSYCAAREKYLSVRTTSEPNGS